MVGQCSGYQAEVITVIHLTLIENPSSIKHCNVCLDMVILKNPISQDLLGVSGLIRGDLVQTPLTGSNSIQGTLTVGPPLWILSWPGGRRYSLAEGRVVG